MSHQNLQFYPHLAFILEMQGDAIDVFATFAFKTYCFKSRLNSLNYSKISCIRYREVVRCVEAVQTR